MKNLKNNVNGITLIALVVTIIILLILAGVALRLALSENGLFKMASQSGKTARDVSEEEKVKLAVSGAFLDGTGTLSTENIKKALENEFGTDKVVTEGSDATFTGTGPWTFKGERNTYTIETNGSITSGSSNSGGGGQVAEGSALYLFDEINDPNAVGYKKDAMHIGDYVNYDAGVWEESKTTTRRFEFEGYTAGQSRNESAYDKFVGTARYPGWRIWDISTDGKITLISAGYPELYYHGEDLNDGYISEYILTGEINSNANATDLGLGTTYKIRDWSVYKNGHEYVEDARAMKKSDLDEWYKKYIDANVTDTDKVSKFPTVSENKLISLVDVGFDYWLCTCPGENYTRSLRMWYESSHRVSDDFDTEYGIRVLVTLKSDVIFDETPTKETYDNFEYNKWSIKLN